MVSKNRRRAQAVDDWDRYHRRQPRDLGDAMCRGLGDVATDVANGAITMAGEGVLYVAQELVYALSPDDEPMYDDSNNTREYRRSRSTRVRKEKSSRRKKTATRSSAQPTARRVDVSL